MKTSPNHLSISLVIPGYNEEASIRETVDRCLRHLSTFTDAYEVIIVDDASTDGMPAVADQMARVSPAIKIVHNPINLGAGASVLVGMRAATGDIICHNSMDYPFDVEDLALVLPEFQSAVSSQWSARIVPPTLPGGSYTSFVHCWIIRLLFAINVRDMNFVQAYRKEVLTAVKVKARSPSFVTPELMIRARDAGFRIAQVEATFHARHKGQASYGKPRDILWALADIVIFWMERPWRKKR